MDYIKTHAVSQFLGFDFNDMNSVECNSNGGFPIRSCAFLKARGT